MAARHWRASDSSCHRLDNVRLHIFSFLQSRPWQYFLRLDGDLAEVSRLVVADSDRQRYPLSCRHRPFLARPVGALSTAAFSLFDCRDHSTCFGTHHSDLARKSSWGRASRWTSLRMGAIQLRLGALHLLGHRALQHRPAIHFVDGRVDARLYRPLFLASVEIVFRLGGPVTFLHCHSYAASRNDWRASRWSRGRRARRGSEMA